MSFKLIFSFIVIVTLLLVGCGKNESDSSEKETSQQNSAEERDINSITVRPELAERLKTKN